MEKGSYGGKLKFWRGAKIQNSNFEFQNVLISTSATKSGVPDPPIRSVSSSEYDVTNFQIISWSKMVQNELFIEFWSKIPHFYPLGGVMYELYYSAFGRHRLLLL